MINRVTLLTSKVWSDLKEKYGLVVFQLLTNLLFALLNCPQSVSLLISHFPPQPISLHPYKPLFPIPILFHFASCIPPVSPSNFFLFISLHTAYTTRLLFASSSSHLHSLLSSLLFPHPHPSTLCATLTLPPSLLWLQTHYFGLWFQGKTQAPAHRWVELEKPLKKQLDKFGNEPLLFFGVMFYVPSVSRLEQEATR